MDWRRVSKRHPCPVCGKATWCTVQEGAAHCMRVESEVLVHSGGWIHDTENLGPLPPPTPQPKPIPPARARELAIEYYQHKRAEEARKALSDRLGVALDALERLGVGCGMDYHGEWFTSWPERAPDGAVMGINRRYKDGKKKLLSGTKHGLIYAGDLTDNLSGNAVFLPEGGSDVAALLTLKIPVIGRFSNLGGVPMLEEALKGYGGAVVVLGEDDLRPSAECGDCTKCGRCYPGKFGAIETAKRLAAAGLNAWWCMLPGVKDTREWLIANPKGDFLEVARNHVWRPEC